MSTPELKTRPKDAFDAVMPSGLGRDRLGEIAADNGNVQHEEDYNKLDTQVADLLGHVAMLNQELAIVTADRNGVKDINEKHRGELVRLRHLLLDAREKLDRYEWYARSLLH